MRDELGLGQRRLAEATRLLASSLDLRQVLDRFAAIALELMAADIVSIWLTDGSEQRLTLDAQAGTLRPDVDLAHRPERDKGLTGCILAAGSSLPIDDLEHDTRVWNRAWYAAQEVRSFLGVPLLVNGTALGVMACMTRAPRAWRADDVEQGEVLATAAAVAIRNARLYSEMREQLRQNEMLLEARVRDAQRLQALNEVSRGLTASLDPREVVETIATFASELVEARLVRLWVLDRASGELALVASGGEDAQAAAAVSSTVRIAPGTGLIGTIFASRQPEFIRDIAEDARWLNRGLSERLGLRGFAGVPLVLKDDMIGVLSIMTRRAGDFSDGQRSLIEGFTSQAALALHNARTFDEQQRRLRETEALLGVADSLGHTRDIGEIMRRVCREATRALGADCGVFYILDEQNGQVLPAAGYHIPKGVLAEAAPLRVDQVPAPMVEARRARRILFVPDVKSDGRFDMPALDSFDVRSLLMAPIVAQDRFFGDVLLYWRAAVHQVSDDDLALMAAISNQAALALENARLLVETQSQATALREKNDELDSFVYTVSHDLKAPLVTIQGMSGMVLEEYTDKLDDDGRHYLQRIVANTQEMERLILDLLALSRSGKEGRPPEDIHLAELVDESVSGLAEPLEARGIKVTVGDLPTIWAVRVHMEQVMKNLLTNAIKYMGDTPSPAIEIGAITRPAELEIWVKDTGIGIDPAYHDKIFEIFQRLKEVEAEGSGVGLPIVKKIVQGAGGRIWVESAPGQGSTFRFTWPVGARR